MSPNPALPLARLREIALALPAAAEQQSHGAPAFFVEGGGDFAYFRHDHHGNGETVAIVKTSGQEEQAMLIEAAPDTYFAPPDLGPSGWIAVRLDRDDVDWDNLADRVAQSWEMMAPQRLLEAGGR